MLWLCAPSSCMWEKWGGKCGGITWGRGKSTSYFSYFCVPPVPCMVWSRPEIWHLVWWPWNLLACLSPNQIVIVWGGMIGGHICDSCQYWGALVTLGYYSYWCAPPLTMVAACIDWWFAVNLGRRVEKSGMVAQLLQQFIVVDVYETPNFQERSYWRGVL